KGEARAPSVGVRGGARLLEEVQHLLVGDLAEVAVPEADGDEGVRDGEADEVVDERADGGGRLAGADGHGEDEPPRLHAPEGVGGGRGRDAGGEPVVEEDGRLPRHVGEARLAAVEQEAAVHLPARLGGQRLERLAVDVEGVEGALVGQRHAGGHGAYAELLVPRRPHLPRDDDVEGGVEGAGDLVAEDDAPAREAEDDGFLVAVGLEPFGELAAGVLPVLEEAAVGHGGAALVRGTPSYAGAPPPFALRRRGSPQFGYPSLP